MFTLINDNIICDINDLDEFIDESYTIDLSDQLDNYETTTVLTEPIPNNAITVTIN